jgi:hypothetical protein
MNPIHTTNTTRNQEQNQSRRSSAHGQLPPPKPNDGCRRIDPCSPVGTGATWKMSLSVCPPPVRFSCKVAYQVQVPGTRVSFASGRRCRWGLVGCFSSNLVDSACFVASIICAAAATVWRARALLLTSDAPPSFMNSGPETRPLRVLPVCVAHCPAAGTVPVTQGAGSLVSHSGGRASNLTEAFGVPSRA